jgi:site-specific DNA-methyltransferase (adenine-specific)
MQHKSEYLDLRLCDNMQLMAQYPDKHFELAICDPPYGIGIDKGGLGVRKNQKHKYKMKGGWDNKTPEDLYFLELQRVSQNQIIWGGQYFADKLPVRGGWICWDKDIPNGLCFSDFELAWTSYNKACKKVRIRHSGAAGIGDYSEVCRIHPTQKPVALYKWLLDKYAKAGDKILDTHLGSGSIAIACHDYKYHLTACELDSDYFAAMQTRIENHLKQSVLF